MVPFVAMLCKLLNIIIMYFAKSVDGILKVAIHIKAIAHSFISRNYSRLPPITFNSELLDLLINSIRFTDKQNRQSYCEMQKLVFTYFIHFKWLEIIVTCY